MNLALYLKDTVIIIPLYSWDPVPINRVYEELLGLDLGTLKRYRAIQERYLDHADNQLELEKLLKGLELIDSVIRRKENADL